MFGIDKLFTKPKRIVNDKKTYIVVIVVLILGGLDALGIFQVPGWAYPILTALGGAALRHGIAKAKAASEEAVKVVQKVTDK